MLKQWLFSGVLVLFLAPWISGFLYAVFVGRCAVFAVWAGLLMVAYSPIVSIPVFMVSGIIGMIAQDSLRPRLLGVTAGAIVGLVIGCLAFLVFQEDLAIWLVVMCIVGVFVGYLESFIWASN